MLGVQNSFPLDETAETFVIKQKTQKFTKVLVPCPLKKHKVWHIYHTVYIPSVKYSLGSMPIEDRNLIQIQKILITKLLARLGYVSTFLQAVAFGPKYYGGIGILSLVGLILSEKVTLLIQYLRSNSSVGGK
eukprot:10157811-Ditylum_brightwellii.AAC.1